MAEKNKTISFRVEEDRFDDLKDMADDLDASLSDFMRDHVEGLTDDEFYREVHKQFYDDDREFEKFVGDNELFDTKWVDETSVDYDKMFEKVKEVVTYAQRRNFDEAEEIIDELDEQGYEQEHLLLNSVVSEYRN